MPLTKNDFRQIENLIDIKLAVFEEKMDVKFNKIMNTLDAILHEITNYRIEQDVMSHQISEHRDRIEKLEDRVFHVA